jgi:hypothetical protein
MGMFDWVVDVADYVEDNVFDPIVEKAEDVGDFVEENVVDPLVDAANDAVDYFEENIFDPLSDTVEDIGEWIEDVAEDVTETIDDAWEDVTQFAEDLWQEILESADEGWDALVAAAEDAWAWLDESVDAAVDWLVNATETVYEFVAEEAIPYIVALVEAIPAVIKTIGALLVLPLCYLFKELFGDEEATVLEGIAEHEPRLLEEFKVARLPVNRKYAVFSDVHMYVDGDLDFFNNNGNSQIYRHALNQYADQNYALIENGDVEDFWMRGGSSKGLILMTGSYLPWPYFSEAFEASAFRAANHVHALNVFTNNATTYATIRTLFHNKDRYTRLIGNHDDVWADPEMELLMHVFYPGTDVNDYCTLENSGTGETELIIAHGHQSDIFNMRMCNFAGKELTNLASVIHELSFGRWDLFSKSKEDWMDEWAGKGFQDELQKIDLLEATSFSEYDLYRDLENTYGTSPRQPYLILGHTHDPKDNAGVPDFLTGAQSNWDEYSNSGTVGMWEQIVIGLEVEYPDVRVVAWKEEPDGSIKSYNLRSYRHGDTYLKA